MFTDKYIKNILKHIKKFNSYKELSNIYIYIFPQIRNLIYIYEKMRRNLILLGLWP